ncbi:MAG TPA: C4-dicarboxylate ABC transporter, partial [Gammaproteobacteria bacterium]
NSGRETSAWAGREQGNGDAPGEAAARERGNQIVKLDDAETARWKAAAEPVAAEWIADMKATGIDGQSLYDQAVGLVAKYAK